MDEPQISQMPQIEKGLNEHIKRHFCVLATGTVFFGVLWAVLVQALDWLSPLNPADREMRYLFAKGAGSISGLTLVLWILLYIEVIINGSILGRIVHDPKALAIFASVLAGVAGYIFVNV